MKQRLYIEITVVVIIFLVLSVLMTYPVITRMGSEIAGTGSDLYKTATDIITEKNQLEQLGFWASIEDIIVNFRLSSIAINGFMSAIFGFPLGYNIFWIFSFVMSGLGTYCLTRTLLKEQAPSFKAIPFLSFLAGIAYAFTPAQFYWANGFRGDTHIEWLPWTILSLHLVLSRPSIKRLLLFLFFLIIFINGEKNFFAFFLLFLIPYLLIKRDSVSQLFKTKRLRWPALAFIIVCIGLTLIKYIDYAKISNSDNNYLNPGINQAITYSNDLLGIITPAYNQSLWGRYFSPLRERFTTNEFTSPSYLGIVVIVLAIFALWRRRSNVGVFWLLIGGSFLILSLGPVLHIAGIIEPRIPLPYLIIYKFVPFFNSIVSVNRLIIFTVLAFGIAASIGLLRILELKVSSIGKQRLIPIILSAFILLEYLTLPVPTTALSHSPFYDKLQFESDEFTILEIPSATNTEAASRSIYNQKIHKKKLVGVSQFPRTNTEASTYQKNVKVPIINELQYYLPHNNGLTSHTAIDTSNPYINADVLNKYNVRYITLLKQFFGNNNEEIGPQDFSGIRDFIQNNIKTRKVYEDDDLIAYLVLPSSANLPVLTLESGWNEPVIGNKTTFQWIANPAILTLDSSTNTNTLILSFSAKTGSNRMRTLQVKNNNILAGEYLINQSIQPIEVNLSNSHQGINSVEFMVLDEKGLPIITNTEQTVALSNILVQNSALQNMTAEDYFNAPLTGNILEIPYRNSTESIANNELRVITPLQILEYYQPKIGNPAASNLPILSDLLLTNYFTDKTLSKLNDIKTLNFYRREIALILNDLDIKHISIGKNGLPAEQSLSLAKYVNDVFPVTNQTETKNHFLFEVNPETVVTTPFINISNFSHRKLRIEPPELVRRLTVKSALNIANPTQDPMPGRLILSTRGCTGRDRIINILQENSLITSFPAGTGQYVSNAIPAVLQPGSNILTFQVKNAHLKTQSDSDLLKCPIGVANISFLAN